MLGHTNITQTQRYAKIVAADIHHDFERVANEMKKGHRCAPPKNKK
jgi:hypothetical protein